MSIWAAEPVQNQCYSVLYLQAVRELLSHTNNGLNEKMSEILLKHVKKMNKFSVWPNL